jgi:hypothetical protein
MTALAAAAPTLGEILAAARYQSAGFARWLAQSDPALDTSLAAVLAPGETRIGRIREAIADFTADASNEDWATLISATRDSDDPGFVALRQMLGWALKARPGQ